MRRSSYETYPGNLPVLSKYVAFITTQRFYYDIQLVQAVFDGRHYSGGPRLFMAWAADVFTEQIVDDPEYNPKGTVQALPRSNYYFFEDPPADPLQLPFDNYYCRVGANDFRINYDGLSGDPATIFQDYVHLVLFNDSFDAPFVTAEEL